MTHLNSATIAAHLAGNEASIAEHIRHCAACAESVAATEVLTHSICVASGTAFVDEPIGARALAHDAAPTVEHVKRLLRESADECDRDPQRATELSMRAVASAQLLTGQPTMVHLLRARAWREHATALRCRGDYDHALASLDSAERELSEVLVGAYEQAQIDYTRSTILWQLGDIDRARALAKRAALVFAEHGDTLREVHVRMLFAGIDFVARNFTAARETYSQALSAAVTLGDAPTIAHLHQNIAACAQEQKDFAVAAMHYASAVALFAHLEMKVEELRVEWNRGGLSILMGHVADGRLRLRRAAAGFRAHGNAAESAQVTLELAQHLVESGERAAAVRELSHASRGNLPEWIRVQLDVLTAAIHQGDPRDTFRDVRSVLMAPPPP